MPNSDEYRNIILVRAGGSLGSALLSRLLQEPRFKITTLLRQSSKSHGSLPPSVRVIAVPDNYPEADLIAAFQGQDVVVNALTSTSVAEQYQFIDAAVIASIKRYVPFEYGLDNLNPKAQELSSVFREKGGCGGICIPRSWPGWPGRRLPAACGSSGIEPPPFLNVSRGADQQLTVDASQLPRPTCRRPQNGDLGRRQGKFSCTTLKNTELALRNVLLKPAETANRLVRVSDFAVSQVELLEAIESLSGEKWTTETVSSGAVIKYAKERLAEGDVFAVYKLIETGFVTGAYGGYLEADGPLDNELLGLPP